MTGGMLVFALPQCGSGMFAEMLGSHPALRCFNEPFEPDSPDPTGRRLPTPTVAQLDAVLRGIWAEWPVVGHVWDPSGWPFPRHSPLNGHVLLSASRVVLISRRNLLRLVVEDAIARRTAEDPAGGAGGGPPEPLDIGPIRWQLKQIPPSLRTHRRALYVRGRPVLDLAYEDLFGDDLDLEARLAAAERVFAFLGHGMRDAGVDLDGIRQRLEPAADTAAPWRSIPNIETIEQQLGADETGWLLR